MPFDRAVIPPMIDSNRKIYGEWSKFRKFSVGCGGISFVVAVLVLVGGWLLNMEFLRSLSPGMATMKVNTAIGIGSLGTALCLLQENAGQWRRLLGLLSASVALLIGLISLIEYGAHNDFGIDQLISADASSSEHGQPPGRPSPATSMALLLLGLALLTLDFGITLKLYFTETLVGIVILLGYVDLLIYWYDANAIYKFFIYESMAIHTSLLVCVLSVGILASRPQRGLMNILNSTGAGGYALRRLFPAVLVIPPLIGWIRLSALNAKLLGFETGLVMHVVSFVAILSIVVVWCARSMELLDRDRRINFDRLQRANSDLEGQVLERTRGLKEEVIRREASERTFSALLESAPDAMVVTDRFGCIVMTNLQTENLFGYRADQLVGEPVEKLIPQRYRGNHVGHRDRYMENPKIRSMGVGLELYGLHCDGHEFPVAVSLSPVTLDQGLVVFSAIRDMREHQKYEQEIRNLNLALKKHNTELEAVNRELESFSYSVSHDLRAPLRAIDGFSQAILEDYEGKLDDEGQDFLRRVRSAAQHMGRLIDDLLRLSRVTRDNLFFESVNLSKQAEEIITDLRNEDPARAAMEVQIEPDLIVEGDRRLLYVVLTNLLGNAWKFTSKNPTPRIELKRMNAEKPPVFMVRDNGVGFDMNYAGKLFGAFQRMHDARDFPGTGIGLATAQRIIHRHGGRVWAEAGEGQGATFYFSVTG